MTNKTSDVNKKLTEIAREQFSSWDHFMDRIEVHDLTRKITSGIPCSMDDGADARLSDKRVGKDKRFITNVIDNLYLNTCTHIDFPGHLNLDNKKLVSEYRLKKHFVGPAIVIDVSDKTKCLEDYLDEDTNLFKIEKFTKDESAHQYEKVSDFFKFIDKLVITSEEFETKLRNANLELEENYFILFHTGLEKYWKYEYFNPAWNVPYFINPYFSDELVSYFISHRVKGIGIDCLQIENPLINIEENDTYFSREKTELIRRLTIINANMAHIRLLWNDILLIENLTNLKAILNKKVLFTCFPPKFGIEYKEKDRKTDDNSFVRATAFEYII